MIWLLGSFLGFTVLGVPLGLAMLLAGILYVATVPGIGFVVVPQQLQAGLDSFPLLAVPFFVLAGALMVEAGVTERLVVLARTMIGHIRGGLAHSLVVAGMILAGCSGARRSPCGWLWSAGSPMGGWTPRIGIWRSGG